MGSYRRALALTIAAIGFVMAQSGGAEARCATVFATDDGPFKSFAVQASLTALKNEIEAVKAKWRVSQVTLSPAQPKPNPYWRGEQKWLRLFSFLACRYLLEKEVIRLWVQQYPDIFPETGFLFPLLIY